MKPRSWAAVPACLLAAGTVAPALHGQTLHPIVVESPTMKTGEMMPRNYSPDGRNDSPPLTWRDVPAGTKQFAVICEDPGAGNPPPWVHWIIYNIPAAATGLPEAIPIDPAAPMPPEIAGAVQGNNNWGRAIYRGPAPPVDQLHHYHFIVYALDAELNLPPGLNRAQLLEAIDSHVIGRGEIVPVYERQPMPAAVPPAEL